MSFSDDEFGYTPLRSMRPTHILGRGVGLAAAAVLFALMVLTFIDVIGRYVFSAPLPSAFELTELSMGILSFLGLPLVSARRGHIAISLVDRLIGRRGRRLQQIVVNLLAALAFAFLTWRMWVEAGKARGSRRIHALPVRAARAVCVFHDGFLGDRGGNLSRHCLASHSRHGEGHAGLMEIALIGTAVLFALLFAGVPIAVGMGVVGFLGFSYVVGFNASASLLGQVTYDTVSNYGLSVLPLFILMGNFVSHARLSEELYAASNAFIGHRRARSGNRNDYGLWRFCRGMRFEPGDRGDHVEDRDALNATFWLR